ncbi:MAG: DUF1990 family protein [Acidimicrobiales bacterium]
MELSGIALGRRNRDRLDALLARRRRASPPTTTSGPPPARRTGRHRPPPHHPRRPGDVATARATLRLGTAPRPPRPHPPADRPPDEGATVVVVLPFGPFEVVAPDRIVAVVDEPDRFGFVYGTLAGHPELGEELFLAERLDDRTLRLTIRIHARPGTALHPNRRPDRRRLQRIAARRYLAAWATAIAEGDPPC